MTPEPFLADIRREVEEGRAAVRREFGSLSHRQIAWRPEEGAWSVGECLDHLVTTDDLYLEEMGRAMERGRRKGITARRPFRGGRFGRWFARAAGPTVPYKVNAPKIFRPQGLPDISTAVVDRYLDIQGRVLKAAEEAEGLDLDRLRISSPVFRLVRFRLGDAFRIVVEHDKRHLAQARRVLAAPGFPVS